MMSPVVFSPSLPRRDFHLRNAWRSTFVTRILALCLGLLAWSGPAPWSATLPVAAAVALPKVYVGLFKDNAVAVLDPRASRLLGTIPVPPGPHGLVVTPDGNKVYVSSDGASTVSVIDTATDRVVHSIDVGATPHGLAIAADGRQVLVSGWGTNQVLLIDTASDRVVGQVPVPQPHNSVFSADGHMAYVAAQQQGATAIVIVDLEHKTQVGTIPLGKTPRALDRSPDQQQLYVTLAGTDAVQVIDLGSKRLLAQIPVGASPHQPLFAPGGALALVASQGPGTLQMLDPIGHTVRHTVAVGKTPHWIAISADGHTAYVTNEGSNDVSVVDIASATVKSTIPVGNAPRKIAVQPGPGATAAVSSPALTPPTTAQTAAQLPPAMRTLGNLSFADHGTAEVHGDNTVEVEADDYYFAPTFLRGKPGQTLTVEIENESGTLHNISIPEQNLDRDVPAKGKIAVEVTFPPSGVVRFFCKIHAALGMNGELLAGDAQPQPVSQDAPPQQN